MITNPVNAIINYTYFCLNFSSNFIAKCWADEPEKISHLANKFTEIYQRKGTGVIPFFIAELDVQNQTKLSNWINENYVGFPHLQDDYQDGEGFNINNF